MTSGGPAPAGSSADLGTAGPGGPAAGSSRPDAQPPGPDAQPPGADAQPSGPDAQPAGPDVPEAFDDPADPRVARRAEGLLREFNQAGVLTSADVHVAQRLADLAGESDDRVRLAVALAVRGIRHGSVCVDLAVAHQLSPATSWPDPGEWLAAVAGSPLAGPGGPVRLELGLLYLDRYWRQEDQVRTDLLERENRPPPVVDPHLDEALDRMFPGGGDPRRAAEAAARRWTTVVGGGPGTGKTTTVARLLAVLADQARSGSGPPRVALAAPTGKAAARLQEAVNSEAAGLPAADRDRLGPLTASTLHRLLGARPGDGSRFRFDRDNRLPHDVIVVDEASMLSLTLTARLLAAVRPDARLVLVGDPDQLASVEAGAVLADLVAGLTAREPRAAGGSSPVVVLGQTWRFGGAIAELAAAVRAGDGEQALAVLAGPDESVRLLPPEDATEEIRPAVLAPAAAIRAAAAAGDAVAALGHLQRHRLLCAHRSGPAGVDTWGRRIERWLAESITAPREGEFYVGRPVLMTANDYALHLFNGDTGVVVRRGGGELRVVFPRPTGLADLAPSRLSGLLTVHAMTVHRSQGSQFERVTVVLPPVDSELCTRELLYTALTRAQLGVTLVASREQVLAAIDRPAARASGLRRRLAGSDRDQRRTGGEG